MTNTGARTTTSVSDLQRPAAEEPCPVTPPNGRNPPDEPPSTGSRYLGNGALFTDLYASPIPPAPRGRERGRVDSPEGPPVARRFRAPRNRRAEA